jgi:predicted enzyme related to lactoylglutathione lyase
MADKLQMGTVGWHDLTVPDAERVRDFYQRVIGLESSPVDMGGYSDFTLVVPGSGTPVAGVCHARGANAGVPPVWMLYFVVEDLERSIKACTDAGGEQLTPIRRAGGGRFCAIKDPAGAVCAIYQG